VLTWRREASVAKDWKSFDQFSGYTMAQLRDLRRLADQVKVGEGKILVREGQFGTEFFMILAGSVEVTQKGLLANILGPGDFFGELAASNCGWVRNATVTALSELELLIIGRRELNALLDIPQFRDALLKKMASRLQAVDAQLAIAARWERSYGSEPPAG
jgi:CRP-like cAMP-binding protein